MMLKFQFLVVCVMLGNISFGQLENEVNIFSFSTQGMKELSIRHDTVSNILTYRFGTNDKIELEISDDLNDSISVFTYSYYFRGGGAGNAGLDLNYVTFKIGKTLYKVYYEYSAEDVSIGVIVINLTTGETHDIQGINETINGGLVEFRFNDLIPITHDL